MRAAPQAISTTILLGIFLLAGPLALRSADLEAGRAPSAEALTPTPAEKDARLGWWREARFGMFMHWGVYSELGGTWHGKAAHGYAEHIQRIFKIPIPVYRKEVAGHFNPTKFDAEAWVKLAKSTGMGYLVITAKHHDGFAMYDSKVSDYNVVKATPFAHDPMKDLAAACKKYGLHFGFYYSHAFDWGEKDAPGNDWDYENPGGDRMLFGANWWEKDPAFIPRVQSYVDTKAIPQIEELIRNYDPDLLWFDTPHKIPPEENRRILAAVRKAKPTIIVDGRIVRGLGDYESTADRPSDFRPTPGDWEGVPTTNESYGYNQNDHSYKPPRFFIRLLAKAAARGGNTLMNVGPMGNGEISPDDVAILHGIGQWWSVNGPSIRGTTRTPLAVQAWGESTVKGNDLMLHVFEWPQDGRLVVGGLKSEVTGCHLLSAPATPIKFTRQGEDVTLDVPATAPDPADSVVVVSSAAPPEADPAFLLSPTMENHLRSLDGTLSGDLAYGAGKAVDSYVMNWTKPAGEVSWPSRLTQRTRFAVALLYDAPPAQKSAVANGDAGKEAAQKQGPAGGTFRISLGAQTLDGTVKTGTNVFDQVGQVTLEPGAFVIKAAAVTITGPELMRLREIVLKPIK